MNTKSISFGLVLAITASLALVSTSIPVARASSGCWESHATKSGQNLLGWTLWQYDVWDDWCGNGSTVTSYYNPWGTQTTCCGWSSNGHSESIYDGGVGQSYVTVHGHAQFSLNFIWYQQYVYVDIYMRQGGDGSLQAW